MLVIKGVWYVFYERRFMDLTGTKHNMVTVLKKVGNNEHGDAIYKCKCECGKEFERLSQHILDKRVKSCGCLRCKRGKNSPNWKGCGDISSSFVGRIKTQAKVRGKDFDLTVEYLWNLFESQNKKCALSGLPLTITKQGNAYYLEGNASLDRIDSSLGYIEGNVQWVDKDINFMKKDFSQEKFLYLCNIITDYNDTK